MKREGIKRMVLGGLLFFIVAPAIFVTVLVVGVGRSVNAIAESDRLSPGESTPLQAGQVVSLLIFDGTTTVDGATQDGSAPATTTCTATDPTGAPANLRREGGTSVSDSGEQFRLGYTLTAGPAGDYKITCGSADVLVMDEDLISKLGRGVGLTLLIAFGVPFIVGVAGLISFIWGLVKFNSSKKQMLGYGNYSQQPYAPGYGQAGYGQQGYPQQGYGQQYPQQPSTQQAEHPPQPYAQQPPDDPYAPRD